MDIKKYQEANTAKDFVVRNGVLVAYTGTDSRPTLPSGIVEIGESAFEENDYIEEIVIPEGVVKIGACAFYMCSELRSVILPQSLRIIETSAFSDSAIAEIKLPSRLESLGSECVFAGTNLKKVVIPGSVRVVPAQAFSGCYYLKEVVLEEGITELEFDAFGYCDNLETIHIPDSLVRICAGTEFGEASFNDCTSLTNVHASAKWKFAHPDLMRLILAASEEA